jgi:hypothetical protein
VRLTWGPAALVAERRGAPPRRLGVVILGADATIERALARRLLFGYPPVRRQPGADRWASSHYTARQRSYPDDPLDGLPDPEAGFYRFFTGHR